jgi:RNA-directed DNA polymerase
MLSCHYFRTGVSKEMFNDLNGFIYMRAQCYMKRRHPMQSGWWRAEKYWGRTLGRQDRWVFQDKKRNGMLRKFAWTKIVRHRLVPTTYSPDDPTLQDYWRQRRAKPQVIESRQRPLVQRQQDLCPVCHQHLENGEGLHIHHVVPKKSGAQMTSRIYGWFITTAIAKFTAAVRLLGYVDGLSRVLGDGSARF